ncbi:MAG: exodeoxyribonuclease VII large subunit [spirochete symbiont of Stewartia floridana]|nr:MAG: exodeoxyribonuclease VII large subunit [spirochete symbiont of Stewartia floridana]
MLVDGIKRVWTVSELSRKIKDLLHANFPFVQVEGEVSNCRPSGAGHVYFSIKDSGAMIAAVMFRGQAAKSAVKPIDGMKIIAGGRIGVYEIRGSYQIIVDCLEESGRGGMLKALEELKHRLAAEGLFAQELKRQLPPYPRRVAVVTSPTGAALRDILQVLARREAAPRVTVLPALVQGKEAAAMMAEQILRADRYGLGDVIILARGGGSDEDRMPFNEEILVRVIAACSTPVISGVGHEIDVSLADLAADVRAATPSAAAELVSDRSEDLLLRVKGFVDSGEDAIMRRFSESRRRLDRVSTGFLVKLERERRETMTRRADDARLGMLMKSRSRLKKARMRYEQALFCISEFSPQAVLTRGYARVERNGVCISSAKMLSSGDDIEIRFAQDRAHAVIKE